MKHNIEQLSNLKKADLLRYCQEAGFTSAKTTQSKRAILTALDSQNKFLEISERMKQRSGGAVEGLLYTR